MQLSLPAEIQREIEERVKSGKYRSAEEVVTAAVATLKQQESYGNFAAGELDTLLAEAQAAIEGGDVVDGDAAFAELRRRQRGI